MGSQKIQHSRYGYAVFFFQVYTNYVKRYTNWIEFHNDLCYNIFVNGFSRCGYGISTHPRIDEGSY